MSATPFAPSSRLDARNVVIAGGLGAVGKATAARLAAIGARIIVLHRKPDAQAKALIESLPSGNHFAVKASITDSASLAQAAQEVASHVNAVHVLVNTAGFTQPVPAADLAGLTDEIIDSIFAANWRGVFATIRAFHPLLAASGDGLIVNVSSISATTGTGSNLAYVAAKAGVDILGKSLARALAPTVRVLTVSPGVVESTFVPGRGADFITKAAASTPLKRVGQPDDVAAAIEACATTLRFATGQTLVVDGGRTL